MISSVWSPLLQTQNLPLSKVTDLWPEVNTEHRTRVREDEHMEELFNTTADHHIQLQKKAVCTEQLLLWFTPQVETVQCHQSLGKIKLSGSKSKIWRDQSLVDYPIYWPKIQQKLQRISVDQRLMLILKSDHHWGQNDSYEAVLFGYLDC